MTTPTITREQFVREWAADLRSGKYAQTRGVLSDSIGYCCLGVGCETAKRLGVPQAMKQDMTDGMPDIWFVGLLGGMLGDDVLRLSDGTETRRADGWNDMGLADFAKIADMLEAKYLTGTAP